MQVVFILAIIFICIAYPILVFIYVWSMPVYVIIAYFIWVFVTIGWICLSERPKISEYVIPVLFFLTVFTLIWASGFGDNYLIEESDEWFWMYVAPALNVPAFCFIGIKLGEFRIGCKRDRLQLWIKELNYHHKYKIEGIDKIITIIQKQYENEKHIEILLNLFDLCIEGNLQEDFGRKAKNNNQSIISEINSIIEKYALQMDTTDKTIGKMLAEANDIKHKYTKCLYNEERVEYDMYQQIKKEHRLYKSKKRKK